MSPRKPKTQPQTHATASTEPQPPATMALAATAAAGGAADMPEPGEEEPPDLSILDRIAKTLPTLTDKHRRAFRRQYSDAHGDALAVKTQARLVVREALTWVAIIHDGMSAPHAKDIRYSPQRFAWFVECVANLGQTLAERTIVHGDTLEIRRQLETLAAQGRKRERSLRETLIAVAGDNEEWSKQTRTLKAPDASVPDLLRALDAVLELSDRWLGSQDEDLLLLLDIKHVDAKEVAQIEAVRTQLRRAYERSLGKRVDLRDTPEINRAEGRVLIEMAEAMGEFEDAHAINKLVPRLVPGRGTRSVLSSRRPPDKTSGDPTPGAPIPPTRPSTDP